MLYESFVRDTMDRIERADDGHPPRAGAGAAHRAQADLQPPGALPQAVRRVRLDRPLARSSTCSTSCSARCSPRTARRWSSPSTSRWPGCSRPTSPRPASPTSSCTAARRSASARRWCARFQAGEVAGLPAVAQGRRHRPQPDPRRPRHPLRPLVEPRRRGAGHRPGLPDRPDPAGAGAPADHQRHHRGADRRAARAQAGAGRRGARRRRGRADRADNDELRDLVTLRREDDAAVTAVAAPPGRPPRTARRGARRTRWWAQGLGARGRGGVVRRGRPARARGPSPAPGAVGQITIEPGAFVAAVEDERRALDGAAATVPVLDDARRRGAGRDGGRRGRPGRRRCWPATCRTPWSSTPRRPASSCCRSAASSARPAPARPGPTRARTRWRCSTSSPGWSRPTRSCCCTCAAWPATTCWPGCTTGSRRPTDDEDDDVDRRCDAALHAARCWSCSRTRRSRSSTSSESPRSRSVQLEADQQCVRGRTSRLPQDPLGHEAQVRGRSRSARLAWT